LPHRIAGTNHHSRGLNSGPEQNRCCEHLSQNRTGVAGFSRASRWAASRRNGAVSRGGDRQSERRLLAASSPPCPGNKWPRCVASFPVRISWAAVLQDLGLPISSEPVSAPTPIEVPSTPFPWHNSVATNDVSGDGRVTARDALLVINLLNSTGSGLLPWPPADAEPVYYYDVDSNNSVTALDALMVIDYLNEESELRKSTSPAEGESIFQPDGVDSAIAMECLFSFNSSSTRLGKR
jgi:hypothetical protein